MGKFLVTGGAGFIGFHLAKNLAERGNQVVIAENFSRGTADRHFKKLLALSNVKLVNADLVERSQYSKLGSGYDGIYHLAAINGTRYFYEVPDQVIRANTLPLFHLVEWVRSQHEGKILFSSSSETYASALSAFGALPFPTPERVPLVIDDPRNTRWSYGVGKIAGEVLLNVYGVKYDLPFSIVRYHNVYGPRMGYEHVIPQLLVRVMVEKPHRFPIFGARQTRTFCYIDDAVEGTVRAMESQRSDGETFHLGQDPRSEITIRRLAGKIFGLVGWHPREIETKPAPPGSVRRRAPDISKAEKLLGYHPRVGLDEGLKLTHNWYANEISWHLKRGRRGNYPWRRME